MNNKIDLSEDSRKKFDQTLKRHGYGFHYSVMREIYQLFNKFRWGLAAVEFPVSVQGRSTRIDFILQNFAFTRKLFMIAECKRVNPAYSDWYFLRKPPFGSSLEVKNAVFENVHRVIPTDYAIKSNICDFPFNFHLYHLGLEVKTGKQGDPWGRTVDAIEKSCTQVSKGVNGLVNYFQRNPSILGEPQPLDMADKYVLVPAIFTTARLLCSDLDISRAELETGDMDVTGVEFEEKPWILYQYHQSPELVHEAIKPESKDILLKSLYQEYVRTIVIVNSLGISKFFANKMWWSA